MVDGEHDWRDRLACDSSRRLISIIATAIVSWQSGGGTPFPDRINAVLDRERAALIELRRDLHRHPEVSGREERTARVVADHLRRLGLTVRIGDPVEYASAVPGVRHLCGHDLHVTVGLGLALTLAAMRSQLAGRVMQRATGAAAMLDAGLFADEAPRVIFGLHAAPMPVGVVASKADRMMDASPAAPGVINNGPWLTVSRGDRGCAGQRLGSDEVEFMTIMRFTSTDAVRVFADDHYDVAYVPDSARALLARWDHSSAHYDVVDPPAGPAPAGPRAQIARS